MVTLISLQREDKDQKEEVAVALAAVCSSDSSEDTLMPLSLIRVLAGEVPIHLKEVVRECSTRLSILWLNLMVNMVLMVR